MHIKANMTVGQPMFVRIVSHNIRYATTSPFPGERLWQDRLPLIAKQLRHETRPVISQISNTPGLDFVFDSGTERLNTGFICLQEVLHGQLTDLMTALNTPSPSGDNTWQYIGVARDDGRQAGEYGPILYQPTVHELVHWETAWLSPNPSKPSRGWDAACLRIVTVGIFETRVSTKDAQPKRIVVANTHLDHQGTVARREGVKVIQTVLGRVLESWKVDAVVLTGDFNSEPHQEAYQAMKNAGFLADARDKVGDADRSGSDLTFTGFGKGERKTRIDYVWLGPVKGNEGGEVVLIDGLDVLGYAVLPNVFDDGVYLSDHRAVVVDLALR
jgi:endonuclease/exonuclease/phosphatase family metal-dependent hydrolase